VITGHAVPCHFDHGSPRGDCSSDDVQDWAGADPTPRDNTAMNGAP
jgi:hypothetical protein